jgi:hypothetical protein
MPTRSLPSRPGLDQLNLDEEHHAQSDYFGFTDRNARMN